MLLHDLPPMRLASLLAYIAGNAKDSYFEIIGHNPKIAFTGPLFASDLTDPVDKVKPVNVSWFSFDGSPDPRVRQTFDPPRPAPQSDVKEWVEHLRVYRRGNPVSGLRLTNEGRRKLYALHDILQTRGDIPA